MGPSRDRRARKACGVRTRWHTVDDGEFFCPDCGGDRNYRRRTGRRRLVVLGLPVLPRGAEDPVVECTACRGHFAPGALDHPTTAGLAAMLSEAVHTVALVVLAAGGAEARSVRETAVEVVHAAGFPECTEDQLTAHVGALGSGREVLAELELHDKLAPLASQLAVAGRESLLLGGARIALADGPYTGREREVLAAAGRLLELGAEDVDRLLAQARTPS
ncbi:TerB family tellurite resistance protein [Streptomyces xiaopingdaonensis]|uniref:TerB family tellurite resistance protein n=1 Tax=Streptomyces xiaopingdaonensis TaxID=1565415 RepID=UPI0003049192|nr:TerB family tellurite resistance protein [Streptomyces xiaopingdaonensis]